MNAGAQWPPLHGRWLILRNCGRFLHVSADFGSEYTTHVHLSSEMLYAGMTREQTRRPRSFAAAMSTYHFADDFDVAALPIWWTVGTLLNLKVAEDAGVAVEAALSEGTLGRLYEGGKSRRTVDVQTFNSTLEATPGVQTNDRLPKYGQMETLLPDRRFLTFAFSKRLDLLTRFAEGQVFWMGKKRCMFQITNLGAVAAMAWQNGPCQTPPIQIGPNDVPRFSAMQVLAASQRCLVVRGALQAEDYLRVGAVDGVPALALAPLLTIEGQGESA
jgi:hypothetical protein